MLIPCSLAGGKYAYVKFEIPQRYLSRFEDVYRQYYCTHGCFDGRKGKGVRVQTSYRFTGCSASITCIVARAANGSLFIKTKNEVSTSILSGADTGVDASADNIADNGAGNGFASLQVSEHNHYVTKDIYNALCRGEAVDARQLGATINILRSAEVPMRNLAEFLSAETGTLNLREIVQNGNAKLHSPFLVCLDCDLSNQDVRNYCTARYGGPDT
jgi:hypothetical protein